MTNDDVKVGIALLEEVENKIVNLYGNVVALKPGSEYKPKYDVKNKELQKQLDIAEKKIGDVQEGLAYLSFLRGRLLAIKQSPMGNREALKCVDHYIKALDLGFNEVFVRYYWGKHSKAWNDMGSATFQFQKIVDKAGADSEAGMEATKEIEKIKGKIEKDKATKGACFLATAVYGSYSAPEIIVLRQFRDEVLLKGTIGRLFVKSYYLLSPPIADFISKKETLKKWVRVLIIDPIVSFIEYSRNNK